jgi:DNA-binding MarR family transcriptional regulator
VERDTTIGFRIRTLSLSIKRAVEASKARSGFSCTGTHGWVIGYLYENRHRDVFQRDIEKQFSVRRPTMTEILKLMEKNGLVVRERDESDARLKKIKLTPLALQLHERHERHIESFESALREGISEEEMKLFFDITERLKENIRRAEEQHYYNPEEEQNA